MITKIQSFTDVITNSSSSVFVMNEYYAEYYNNLENASSYVYIKPITIDWIKQHPCEFEMICDIAVLNKNEVSEYIKNKYGGFWTYPDIETWNTFIDIHEDIIKEKFKDLYWVDIEDHFEDAWDVTQEAITDSIWYEYRH